ncbi:hypothetical protein [Pseudoruegeria sp. HB172150]|uniref:hypothetical protein n=1 Tax=Pseudoruegeria sp. HB172150 TaxID=2721164 RepID=UPI001557AA94|nr:hypothetical protein [Pseudoruegeria sp. HB172150]
MGKPMQTILIADNGRALATGTGGVMKGLRFPCEVLSYAGDGFCLVAKTESDLKDYIQRHREKLFLSWRRGTAAAMTEESINAMVKRAMEPAPKRAQPEAGGARVYDWMDHVTTGKQERARGGAY